ncbi:uncharacterized protein LOC135198651 [Macrobrachium nipponense]|uniref:uncharacterized protein LOC135198651 n=1 Tax=Macrobrachium nipponense TaxID=159736 RepID=UPI0030C8A9DB
MSSRSLEQSDQSMLKVGPPYSNPLLPCRRQEPFFFCPYFVATPSLLRRQQQQQPLWWWWWCQPASFVGALFGDCQKMFRPVVLKSALCLLVVVVVTSRLRHLQALLVTGTAEEQVEEEIKLVPDPTTCVTPPYVSFEKFLQYETQKQYECQKLVYFGVGDGSKGVCMDPDFLLDKNNCTVLSFGIKDDWTFDDSFGAYGCKVYSFDPSIGKSDHQHAPNVKFFNLGISNQTETAPIRRRSCRLETYEKILKRIGLLDSVIDYLKMDVERSELKFFYDIFTNTPHLLANIKQIGMETHYDVKGYKELFWDYYHRLACHGFKLMDARQFKDERTEIVWGRP